MTFYEWKRTVWPTLSDVERNEVLEEVLNLRMSGWSSADAWIQAACTHSQGYSTTHTEETSCNH
jgi:hypothetical protein